ncbi:tetratricopeptide repeat protein [Gaoshiqia sp. Z1-71]|uniref:tetratricopeptide repeat protein n=1 Tax=Gaoshiqia hydrogeniformans TaxID=3290090 RepID=UPI003BF90046
MKRRSEVIMMIFVTIIMGCSAPKVIVSHRANAETAEAEGRFEAATQAWSRYFDQQLAAGSEISPEEYARAAKTAYRANEVALAESWFGMAQYGNYADPGMYKALAAIYRQQNNLNKELTVLEAYQEHYPEQADTAGVSIRLFDRYTGMGNKENALKIWPFISAEKRKEEKYLNQYFLIQRQLDQKESCDTIAGQLLEINPKHVDALEWLGDKYYRMAEDRYQREMKKYENKRTHVQHLQLVQELKLVTADFQQALTYFKVLWEMNPGPKYAPYLVNIYTRFENPEQANYYRKYLE